MAHLSVASLTQVVLLLILICWTPSSTGAAFSLEEEFLQLKENYIQMKQVLKSLEAKDEQMEAQLELNNELRQDLALKVIQLEAKNDQLEVKIGKLEAKVEQQDSLLTSLLREKNERSAAATGYVPISNNQSAVAINGLPSSCEDLKMIGHTLSGFYSVMGLAKMESVYCDFTKLPGDAGFQKFIGYADVKSAPVHFYVQRNSSINLFGKPIPFDLARVNEGNAMDLTSGIFTASRPGIYFFSFSAVAHLERSSLVNLYSYLYLNGNIIGSSWVGENKSPVDQYSPVTLQSMLNLKTGDQVWVDIYYTSNSSSYLVDYPSVHYTDFTGWMLEEEIVASL
ncbi:uncharacterized protein LOC124316415 [Daphnia pulicaria]|uniref:uncharacterized protein LOC124316415 n=1 Tax=Daphnia pulicaria TaxID=35523 RepID=UPI001EEC6CE6|nr:uncharacterized protein LOC124316415 [Daphnia pulicaria]